jgi:DNA polymerase-3 subunit gamma/tau
VVLQVAHDKPHLVELSAEERRRASELAKRSSLLELQRVFAGVAKLVDDVATASTPRTILEMGAVRLATRPKLEDLAQLIARVEQLAQQPEGAQRSAKPGPAREAPAAPRPAPSGAGNAPAVGGTVRTAPAAGENPFQRFVPPESRDARERPERSSFGVNQGLAVATLPASAVAPPAVTPSSALEPTPAADSVQSSLARGAARLDSRPDNGAWATVVERLRSLEPRWAAMYEHGVPSEVGAARVVVAFPEGSFFGRQAQTAPGSDALRRAASEVFGGSPEIVIKLAAEVRGQSLAQSQAQQLDERKEGIKKRALNHPRVLEALKVFPELAKKQDIQVD